MSLQSLPVSEFTNANLAIVVLLSVMPLIYILGYFCFIGSINKAHFYRDPFDDFRKMQQERWSILTARLINPGEYEPILSEDEAVDEEPQEMVEVDLIY